MELIDIRRQEGEPVTYTFVFRPPNEQGDYPMVRMPDSPQWPYSPFIYGEYRLGERNEHLGERMTLQEVAGLAGGVILDRFFSRLGY